MASELTWGELRNHVVEDYSTVAILARLWVFNLKKFLTGAIGPGGPGIWTVERSSNGTLFGAADYWNTLADIVWSSSGNHSWIVLYNATLGARICLDVAGGAAGYPLLPVFASAPWTFTGGTLSARPTSLYECRYDGSLGHYFDNNITGWLNNDTATPMKHHGLLSTRGDFWFMGSHDSATKIHAAIGFTKLQDLVFASDPYPHVMYFLGNGLPFSAKSWSNVYDDYNRATPAFRARSWDGAVIVQGSGFSQGIRACLPIFRMDGNEPNWDVGPMSGPGGQDQATTGTPIWPFWFGVNQDNPYYKQWKGRWADAFLTATYLNTNSPMPSLSAQERLSLDRTLLPFAGGILSM